MELISRALRPSVSAAGDSSSPMLSGDGQWIAFQSTGGNLHAAGGSRGFADVYLQELATGRRELVSVNTRGVGGNGESVLAGVSGDGRYVLFVSDATDLVDGDDNEATDIFVRDRVLQVTRWVSVAVDGESGDGDSSQPLMTPDGRWVVFESAAENLVEGDTNAVVDVFLRDMEGGTTRRISVASSVASVGSRRAGDSTGAMLSRDGGTVLYRSSGLNLAPAIRAGAVTMTNDLFVLRTPAETNRMVDVFEDALSSSAEVSSAAYALSDDGRYVALALRSGRTTPVRPGVYRVDLDAGTFDLVSDGLTGAADVDSRELLSPVISGDGQTVVFEWFSTTQPIGGVSDPVVYAWNAIGRVPERVSSGGWVTNSVGEVSESRFGGFLAASPDARFVAFVGGSTNDPPGFPAGQLVVRDRSTGELRRVTRSLSGVAVQDPSYALVRFSHDGKRLTFQSRDDRLVPGDRNKGWDVFVYDWETDRLSLVSTHAPDRPSRTPYGSVQAGRDALSADGRYVAYMTLAPDDSVAGSEAPRQVLRLDRLTGTSALVSVRQDGGGGGKGSSDNAVLSRDGRFVVFTSHADDLVVGDTNTTQDVFLRDMELGVTTLVSRRPDGGFASGPSSNPVLSPDARWVAFESRAADLSPLDVGRGALSADVFLFDRLDGKLKLISVSATGTSSGNGGSGQPVFSPDGKWLVFESLASNLIEPAPGSGRHVYARQLETGHLRRMAVPGPLPSNTLPGPSPVASFSPEGRYATVLVGGRSGAPFELVLHDFQTADTTRLAPSSLGATLSRDALRIAYATGATTRNGIQIRVVDRLSGADSLVSASPNGLEGNASSDAPPQISADGHWVVFSSGASNLVPSDTNGFTDVFVKNLDTGELKRFGGNLLTAHPVLSADGSTVLFRSFADGWVEGDYNGNSDLFAVSLPSTGPGRPVLAWGSRTGEKLRLSWGIRSGKSYRVLTASRVLGPWTDTGVTVSTDGAQGSAEVPWLRGVEAAYYRLEER